MIVRAEYFKIIRDMSIPNHTLLAGIWVAVFTAAVAARAEDRATAPTKGDSAAIDFGRQIRPILSENCFACHGPDEQTRKGKLRLDTKDGALANRDGNPAIVAGKPDESELLERITAADESVRMPPVKTGKKLSPAQVDLLRTWIAQGAPWRSHWAFDALRRPVLPTIRDTAWPRNAIDQFVMARLEQIQLRPAPTASKETLLRRLTLDLTGLPPKPTELDSFLNDNSPDAYERVVDRLLNSPHYGERMALDWLDAARYADTNGYFSDLDRSMWPWRDWVIDAFNRNMPFDQFTIEQLAGDLLPNPTTSQLVATGFHRNQPVTNESGVIDEEYRVEYVADRVDTTAAVWLGLTMGCARCHDHKFDPLSQREYYQLFSFFNQGPETGLVTQNAPPPTLAIPTPDQIRLTAELQKQREACERAYAALEPAVNMALTKWEATADQSLPVPPSNDLAACFDFNQRLTNTAGTPAVAKSTDNLRYAPGIAGKALELDGAQNVEVTEGPALKADESWSVSVWFRADGKSSLGCVLSKVEPDGDRRGFEILLRKQFLAINLIHRWGRNSLEVVTRDPFPTYQWHHLVVAYDGGRNAAGLAVYVDGVRRELRIDRDSLAESAGPEGIENAQPWRIGRRDSGLGFSGWIDELRFYRRLLTEKEAADTYRGGLMRSIVKTEAGMRTPDQKRQLLEFFLPQYDTPAALSAWQELNAARQRERDHQTSIPIVMVARELDKPRDTFVLVRGQYDKPGDKVRAGVPAVLPPLPEGFPANRLGLALWIVHPDHPLTARVAVNRLWKQFFGEGLVRTVNDFGSQGEPATHPELLDMLATEFVRSGWDVKALVRLIVTSSTYRQSAARSPELEERDPGNRLLARGPRFRLSGEIIRDQALAASGLLAPLIGGPSVKPYQPAGLWEAVSYGADQSYTTDRGPSLYRRGLYTYWKRQAPPPSMVSFDAPTRETCVVSRSRTNTPLQALVVMNDPTYVEAARVLATRLMKEWAEPDRIIREGMRHVISRSPTDRELSALRALWERRRVEFRAKPDTAKALIRVGEMPVDESLDPPDLAAWTIVTSLLLNLDETLTKP